MIASYSSHKEYNDEIYEWNENFVLFRLRRQKTGNNLYIVREKNRSEYSIC